MDLSSVVFFLSCYKKICHTPFVSNSFWSPIFCLLWQSSGGKCYFPHRLVERKWRGFPSFCSRWSQCMRSKEIFSNQAKSPSTWGSMLFSNSILKEQRGGWRRIALGRYGLCPRAFLAAQSSCEALRKALPGINRWEVSSISTVLPDAPPHTVGLSQHICARCWLLRYCWLVTGSKDIFHHMSIEEVGKVLLAVPGAPTFLTPSIDRAQGTMWFTIMHMTKNWDSFHLPGYLCINDGSPWTWFYPIKLRCPIWAHLLSSIHRDGERQPSWRRCIPHALDKCLSTGWIVLGNFLSLSIPIERTWINDSGSVTAIRQTAFQQLELIWISVVPIFRESATFQLFQRMNPLFTQMERDEHIFPSSVLTALLFWLPLRPLPNSVLRSDKPKLKDQDCKSFSFNFAVWFQLQTGCIWGEKNPKQFMFDNSGVYLTSQKNHLNGKVTEIITIHSWTQYWF